MKKTIEIEQCSRLSSKHKERQFIITYVFKIGSKKRCKYILNTNDFEMTEPLTSSCKQEKKETMIDIAKYILAKKKQRYRKCILRLKHYHYKCTSPSCFLSNYLHERVIGLYTFRNPVQASSSTINL